MTKVQLDLARGVAKAEREARAVEMAGAIHRDNIPKKEDKKVFKL